MPDQRRKGTTPQPGSGLAGIVFAAWLGVTAVAVAVTVVLYARDLSKPQADFTLAVVALLAAVFALTMTCSAWPTAQALLAEVW